MAHEAKQSKSDQLQLPLSVSSIVDVGRLERELDTIDGAVLQSKLKDGAAEVKMPKTSHFMEQVAQLNEINLIDENDRAKLKKFLASVRTSAPTIHMSFSADPAPSFIEKIMTWLRREIHPLILLTVGMQPNIGAGTIVRTANKQFDFSLRKDFEKRQDLLVKSFTAASPESTQPAAVTKVATEPTHAHEPTDSVQVKVHHDEEVKK